MKNNLIDRTVDCIKDAEKYLNINSNQLNKIDQDFVLELIETLYLTVESLEEKPNPVLDGLSVVLSKYISLCQGVLNKNKYIIINEDGDIKGSYKDAYPALEHVFFKEDTETGEFLRIITL